ncbi:branched-chain amino acid ABC transporter permease [Paracoccus sediminicola]|uniref:branched-chain amino acid ABC transporter permease n=1 Tax=Paracoccus sediminicola TaxID=3017783 RepID=UPI0022F06AD9|nr:branched-chain amino acid ABC transporter permease [Paracoccus sediminicola]WBU56812.1 branched-chain amino acid ABC transporter permease [Paracoccus sediminicola]
MSVFWTLQALNALQYAALLFLISAGLSVSFGLMGFVNLAHGALYMLGAYIGVSIAGGVGFWTALIVAPLAIGAIGAALHQGLLRRIAGAGPMPQVLVSFGLVFLAVEAVRIIWGDVPLTLDVPKALSGTRIILDTAYPSYRLFVILLGGAVALSLWAGMTRSHLGAAIRAAVENRDMARAIGIRTERLFLAVFTLGASLAGLGGVIAAPILSVSPSMAVTALIPALIVTVIGGLGSIPGAMLGAVIVAAIEVFGAALWPDASAVLIYAALAAALIWRPEGLLSAGRAR